MKRFLILITLFFLSNHIFAQQAIGNTKQGSELYFKAKNYIQQSDYANAIMVFNQAVNIEPDNQLFNRELAYTYFLLGDVIKAEKVIKPLLKNEEVDEQTFQVASKIYRALKKTDDAKTVINKGISKYPTAGALYSEKGEIYTQEKKYKSASEAWEKGVENAPSYHLNYYNLTKVYFFTKQYLWAIIYGETFVNMESFSAKSEELKKIIFESYKFLISDLNNKALDGKVNRYEDPKNFETSCYKVFDDIKNIVTGGINSDNLSQLRMRFVIDWNKQFATTYPLALFDYQQQMILNQHFDPYNKWLFGNIDNSQQYKQWTQKFASQMNHFDSYFRNNKLIPRENQYYHK
ncbi:MAG: tetratricopeptide repeat protein [Chitinophagaceae bacterium]|nr:MAG: Tetratricopeptide repeat protein [Bacteroidetes bacterium OLB11]MCC6448804.1 tetratricopeptide repeat protein [Chitinophagaceae bacterium]HMN32676.1 tetratricopeptide repeat protein [Chitinophagaceae bacterium]